VLAERRQNTKHIASTNYSTKSALKLLHDLCYYGNSDHESMATRAVVLVLESILIIGVSIIANYSIIGSMKF